MDPSPITTAVLYIAVWAAWVYTNHIFVTKQNINFALKLDENLYNDSFSQYTFI
jgi:hypothetical protein